MRPAPGGGEEAGGNVRIIKKVQFEKWELVKSETGDGDDAPQAIHTLHGGSQDLARLEFEYRIRLNDQVCQLTMTPNYLEWSAIVIHFLEVPLFAPEFYWTFLTITYRILLLRIVFTKSKECIYKY